MRHTEERKKKSQRECGGETKKRERESEKVRVEGWEIARTPERCKRK